MNKYICTAGGIAFLLFTNVSACAFERVEHANGQVEWKCEGAGDCVAMEAAKHIDANAKAAAKESGDIDKVLRIIPGVSVADIRKENRLCGGENSFFRKNLGLNC